MAHCIEPDGPQLGRSVGSTHHVGGDYKNLSFGCRHPVEESQRGRIERVDYAAVGFGAYGIDLGVGGDLSALHGHKRAGVGIGDYLAHCGVGHSQTLFGGEAGERLRHVVGIDGEEACAVVGDIDYEVGHVVAALVGVAPSGGIPEGYPVGVGVGYHHHVVDHLGHHHRVHDVVGSVVGQCRH